MVTIIVGAVVLVVRGCGDASCVFVMVGTVGTVAAVVVVIVIAVAIMVAVIQWQWLYYLLL